MPTDTKPRTGKLPKIDWAALAQVHNQSMIGWGTACVVVAVIAWPLSYLFGLCVGMVLWFVFGGGAGSWLWWTHGTAQVLIVLLIIEQIRGIRDERGSVALGLWSNVTDMPDSTGKVWVTDMATRSGVAGALGCAYLITELLLVAPQSSTSARAFLSRRVPVDDDSVREMRFSFKAIADGQWHLATDVPADGLVLLQRMGVIERRADDRQEHVRLYPAWRRKHFGTLSGGAAHDRIMGVGKG